MNLFPGMEGLTSEQRSRFMSELQTWAIMANTGTVEQKEQARQWFKEHFVGAGQGLMYFKIEEVKPKKMEKATAEDILAFNALFKHYINLAEGDDHQFKEACVWIKNRFEAVGQEVKEMFFVSKKQDEERFHGFGLSVQEMNSWHPFTLAFEAHRIGREGLQYAMSQPFAPYQYHTYMRLVSMFLIVCQQYMVVKKFLRNCVFYTVQAGDTLQQIAVKNNTSITHLMELNPEVRKPNKIYAGQQLRVVI